MSSVFLVVGHTTDGKHPTRTWPVRAFLKASEASAFALSLKRWESAGRKPPCPDADCVAASYESLSWGVRKVPVGNDS